MTSIQDRTKMKRVSYDTWSTREQLCLASSVLKSGDQNWIGVSRSLKPFAEKEALRPPDWFSQKSCAKQYAILLENADAPKRKKRETGETSGESIVRRLTQERIAELGQILAFQRDEYQQLKAEVNLLRSGTLTEEKLQKMWLAIEQEERDQEHKARAHAAWLAKRQHKHEVHSQSLQTVTIASPRKSLEQMATEAQEVQGENDEEERKNRGGRSPLLTSLLKSPSPTTQMQTVSASVQPASSPTIASLLGSSPKVPNAQIAAGMPPQLHQLVTSAMTNAVAERPSVGAPTLSMLLELPANLQRASLASLQQAASNVQQQIAKPDTHNQSHTIKQTIVHMNENTNVRAATLAPIVTPNESMVQIIDQVDDVIRKDIMADVINKDEINEIIGDLEELIKEEITASSPRKTPPMSVRAAPMVLPLVEKPPPPPEIEKVVVSERLEPRDVDEAVSLSNSPQSEMAIEEIDQSTSSIAEIIGTVAIEPVEPKVTVVPVVDEEPATHIEEKRDEPVAEITEAEKMEEEIVQEAKIEEKSVPVETDIPEETGKESIAEESSVTDDPVEEPKVDEKPDRTTDDVPNVEATSPVTQAESPSEKETEKESEEPTGQETCEIAATDEETAEDSVDEPKESTHETKETKETNDPVLDEIKVNLAKITGEENEVGSAEVVSVCSEVTTDIPSIEDNEKSQDIGMILEDDESSQSSSSKKKDTDDQSLIENLNDASDSQESFKDACLAKEDPPKEAINESSTDVESPRPDAPEENVDYEKVKVEDSKDYEEDCASSASSDVERKDKMEEATVAPDVEEESVDIDKTESNEKEEKQETVDDEEREEKEEKEEKEEDEEEDDDEEEEEEEEDDDDEEEGEEEEDEDEVKAETALKEEREEEIGKEETEPEESSKPEVQEIEEKKCSSPVEDKPDVKDESDNESLIKQLEEPKKEEPEVKEEKEDDEKPMDSDVSVKKDTVESAGSICDDIADLDEEESSLSKLSGGRAMKTYSKKQTIAVDSEPENESSGENADYRAWKKAVMLVYNRLATHKYASVFLRPITEDQAPGYHSVIFRPMDLSTIKKNIDNGTIRSTMHFQRDVMLMFQNAIMYNKQDTFVYKMAVSMQEECLQHMQILVQVTGEGQLRRETRTAASSSSETSDPSIKRKRSHITPSPHDTESPRGKKRRKSENE